MDGSSSEALLRNIFLAGGCFWGLQKYMDLIPGVVSTQVGYANGKTRNPTYEEVCHAQTGHAETVKVEYDPDTLPLKRLLSFYFDAIDPLTRNRQGYDVGPQYRTGIYYESEEDRRIAEDSVAELQKKYSKPVMVEVVPLEHYDPAEEEHQKYLEKHPAGYCHIGRDTFKKVRKAVEQL
ncbi:MAG: peptide-methionine (S)-S-oxide reductase MsrA [Eubacteriales bacterium]|jgi:peptide methionine sulfoxide reductase msrA/msrB|nr:peptide-methionine (S)-S-oxide reductase MsrA [Eubacteriales bacterium]MDD3289911.1 peptide-methionine (S)-S-oxide reductase MsrA [Eubacteriales bacterium]MDD3863045.1 peptide-methionine (S)-S-oxide reductase MsrA [Eubacteriales bacterium]MDD4445384.1 peptide-methionine (S)-S-oxide reductase MsrA [Eubacteriales bacterium]